MEAKLAHCWTFSPSLPAVVLSLSVRRAMLSFLALSFTTWPQRFWECSVHVLQWQTEVTFTLTVRGQTSLPLGKWLISANGFCVLVIDSDFLSLSLSLSPSLSPQHGDVRAPVKEVSLHDWHLWVLNGSFCRCLPRWLWEEARHAVQGNTKTSQGVCVCVRERERERERETCRGAVEGEREGEREREVVKVCTVCSVCEYEHDSNYCVCCKKRDCRHKHPNKSAISLQLLPSVQQLVHVTSNLSIQPTQFSN